MNLVADEGVDRHIVDRLRQDGHQVFYVAEMQPGIPDEAVLDLENHERALLVTADEDSESWRFASVARRPGSYSSAWQGWLRSRPRSWLLPYEFMRRGCPDPLLSSLPKRCAYDDGIRSPSRRGESPPCPDPQ